MALRWRAELPELDGATEWVNGQADRRMLLGKPVLVHFWALSCQLCKDGFPIINFWKEVYGDAHQLQIIGVHMPRTGKDKEISAVKQMIQQYEMTHPILLDQQHIVSAAFQNEWVPAYYVFDDQLRLRHYQAGDSSLDRLDQSLKKVLGAELERGSEEKS